MNRRIFLLLPIAAMVGLAADKVRVSYAGEVNTAANAYCDQYNKWVRAWVSMWEKGKGIDTTYSLEEDREFKLLPKLYKEFKKVHDRWKRGL